MKTVGFLGLCRPVLYTHCRWSMQTQAGLLIPVQGQLLEAGFCSSGQGSRPCTRSQKVTPGGLAGGKTKHRESFTRKRKKMKECK